VNSTLRVVDEINPDALSIAAQLDAERANGTTRGWAKLKTRFMIVLIDE